jgi:xanthine dehydrogenase YagR molybdenum-binding subunit
MTVLSEATTRIEAPQKVSGQARYAFEQPVDDVAYAWPVPSTIAKGRIRSVDDAQALDLPGVLAVITPENAPRLAVTDDPELHLFQTHDVSYRGQFVAAVVANSLEVAREAAEMVHVDYDPEKHDVILTADHPGLYAPHQVNAGFATDSALGDFDTAFSTAAVQVDETYRTPAEHNSPMEPHATTASWDGDHLTLFDSNQGPSRVEDTIAELFDLDPSQVRIVAEHVGGGFGSKGIVRPNAVIATMAARIVQRPVKCVVTRQQMFAVVGYRTPSIQRVRLGADRDGRLTAIAHDVIEQSSTLKEFAEQTATPARHMYAAANRRTSHRLVRLDVPSPFWMRAPGKCPGMFALECAMDELAVASGIDPIELRLRNEPATDPESALPFSSRNLVACLREGAARFGWDGRDATPGVRRDGRWLVGTGVASSTYPAYVGSSQARAAVDDTGRYEVSIAAVDIGTGARTALSLVAAEALGVPTTSVDVRIGDSDLPQAPLAGGSRGTLAWSWAIIKACQALRDQIDHEPGGRVPPGGLSVEADTTQDVEAVANYSRYSFGAQFAEVRVDSDTGEVRVPRLSGVFAAGHIVNPMTARSQLIGGMTMGLSMALHEESAIDPRFGDFPNHDLASYHIATCADVGDIDAVWIDEDDRQLGPNGVKGVGELGIVGTAAAIANAVHHATGVRVRDLPIRLDKLLGR